MLAVIDYSIGNSSSVANAFKSLGEEVIITGDKEKILAADHVVLPGVGAFSDSMKEIEERGLLDTIKQVIDNGTPFLGICVGFQLLFEESHEFGHYKGFGFFKGTVVPFKERFDKEGLTEKIPQIGWNSMKQQKQSFLFDGVEDESYVYFVHSFYVEGVEESITIATTDYGFNYCSAIEKDNVVGVQFHPEKSQKIGLKLLKNFLNKK